MIYRYIFYSISGLYSKMKMEINFPEMGGGAVTSLFQGFNIVALLYFLFSVNMTPVLWIFIWSCLTIFNWIFIFNRKNLKKYKTRWDEEELNKRIAKRILVIVYFLASIFFFGLALSKMW